MKSLLLLKIFFFAKITECFVKFILFAKGFSASSTVILNIYGYTDVERIITKEIEKYSIADGFLAAILKYKEAE